MTDSTKSVAREIAGCIDHTLLKPEVSREGIIELCSEAVRYDFATVCVHGWHVALASSQLEGHKPKVCSVAGFPYGTNHSMIKRAEAVQAIAEGANEIDMVVNLGAALEGDFDYVRRDIEGVLKVCRQSDRRVLLKVILETAALPVEVKVELCRIADELGVDFIKTSTGLHPAGGATIEDVELLYENRGSCRVKAAGGIGDLATVQAMLKAGAQRIGTSSGVAIMKELLLT